MKKRISFMLVSMLIVITLVACSKGGLPNGRYELAEGEYAMFEAIVINGNNITMTMMGAMSQTNKYTYKNGTLTYQDGGTALNVACSYDSTTKTLDWSGVKYNKVK